MAATHQSDAGTVSSRKPPGRHHHGDLERAVIARALELVDRGGLQALTLANLSGPLGITPAAPLFHFGDRAGLLAAVAAECFEQLAQQLRTAGEGTEGGDA